MVAARSTASRARRFRLLEVRASREQQRPQPAPGDLRIEIVGDRPPDDELDDLVGIGVAVEQHQGLGEDGRDGDVVAVVSDPLERLRRGPGEGLGGVRPAGEKLDLRGLESHARSGDLEPEVVCQRHR